jgi:hypothetical protein
LVLVESREGMLEIVDQGVSLPGFHDHIIDVGFDQIILDLISKALLDSSWYVAHVFLTPNDIVV